MRPPPKTAITIKPSDAIALKYRREMVGMVRAMAKDIHKEVMGVYRPYREMRRAKMVGDASVVEMMVSAFKRLQGKWGDDTEANKQARSFVKAVDGHVVAGFTRGLRREVKDDDEMVAPSPAIKRLKGLDLRTTQEAAIADNVSLIKSIPEKYLNDVQNDVMRGLQDGWPLDRMSASLQHRYGITKRRADTIARDQCAKVTENLKTKRAIAVGFTEGVWWHSDGSRHPRKSHQAANGKRFDLSKGCEIDGEFIFPGQEINCKCFSTFHLPNE